MGATLDPDAPAPPELLLAYRLPKPKGGRLDKALERSRSQNEKMKEAKNKAKEQATAAQEATKKIRDEMKNMKA